MLNSLSVASEPEENVKTHSKCFSIRKMQKVEIEKKWEQRYLMSQR